MRLPQAWAVLHVALFMALWSCALISNIGTLMQEVGVTWLMTSLDSPPIMVSLIQTAEAMPFFLLALPAGALADIVDRRRLVLFSQFWMFLLALLLGVLTLLNVMTPSRLLILTALLGLGMALNGPVYQAIIPQVVAPNQLSSAIALNSAGFNVVRAIGPGIGGLVVAMAVAGAAFLLNAASFLGSCIVGNGRYGRTSHPPSALWGPCVQGFDTSNTLNIFKLCLCPGSSSQTVQYLVPSRCPRTHGEVLGMSTHDGVGSSDP